MATYKTIDLLNKLHEVLADGYLYVDVSELDSDEKFPDSLCFEAIGSDSAIDFEEVESVDIPADYDFEFRLHSRPDELCHTLPFTYEELLSIHHALGNALEYTKDYLKDPSCTRGERDEIKTASVDWRNLEAKLAKFFKHLNFH